VQATSERGVHRLYSRTGDDISHAFPDLLDAFAFDGALDGELLVARPQGTEVETGSFSDLQQRLNRKKVSAKQLRDYPAFLRAYDLLQQGWRRICARCPSMQRRERLERFVDTLLDRRAVRPARRWWPSKAWDEMAKKRNAQPDPVIEGLMIKRKQFGLCAGAAERRVVQMEA
jgi:DNA ligase-1